MKKLMLFASLSVLPLTAVAQVNAGTPVPSAECSAILAKPFDGGLDPRVTADCDSTAYYYGIGRGKDFPAARSCAFIERIEHVDKDGSLFTGAGILSEVYANGEGTPRDLDLARRFVCENKEAAPEEIEKRLRSIDKIAGSIDKTQAPKFDLCATAATAPTWGWCAGLQLRIHDAKRYDDLVAMVDKLTPQQQESFKALQTAEGAFEASRVAKEVDQSGQTGWTRQLQEQDKLRAEFAADFNLFAKPAFKEPVTFPVIDGMIGKENGKLLAKGSGATLGSTTITVAGVEETQVAWLKYRDAWRAYEGAVNPAVSGDDVATQISRERLFHLRKLTDQ